MCEKTAHMLGHYHCCFLLIFFMISLSKLMFENYFAGTLPDRWGTAKNLSDIHLLDNSLTGWYDDPGASSVSAWSIFNIRARSIQLEHLENLASDHVT
jgi:hypothetical protein